MGGTNGKIAIVIVAFALAGGIWYWTSRPEPAPELKDPTLVDLICEACGEHSQDSPEHLLTVLIKGGVRTPTEGGGMTRHQAVERPVYPCPKCNEPTAVMARYCQTHQKYYPAQLAEGGAGKCPDCP